MKLGTVFGFIATVMGGVFTYIGYDMMISTNSVFKFFLAGPPFTLIGLSMLFFSGGNITAMESRNKTKDPNVWLKEAPKSHKTAWFIAGAIGVIISMVLFRQI